MKKNPQRNEKFTHFAFSLKNWDTGLLASIFFIAQFAVILFLYKSERDQSFNQFKEIAQTTTKAIEKRLSIYENILTNTAATIEITNSISTPQWAEFVSRLDLSNNYPGLKSLGYAPFLPKQSTSTDTVNLETSTLTQKLEYQTPIQLLYPQSELRYVSIGYNMYSSKKRRQAMQRAAALNKISLTSRLLANEEPRTSTGLILYSPVYSHQADLRNETNRAKYLTGFVYGLFSPSAALNKIVQENLINIEIYDDVITSEKTLIYSSSPHRKNSEKSLWSTQEEFDVFGQTWVFKFDSKESLEKGIFNVWLWLFIAVFNAVIFFAIVSYLKFREHLIRSILKNTSRKTSAQIARLSQESERLSAALMSQCDTHWEVDIKTNHLHINSATELLLPHLSAQNLKWTSIFTAESAKKIRRAFKRAIANKQSGVTLNVQLSGENQQSIDVLLHANISMFLQKETNCITGIVLRCSQPKDIDTNDNAHDKQPEYQKNLTAPSLVESLESIICAANQSISSLAKSKNIKIHLTLNTNTPLSLKSKKPISLILKSAIEASESNQSIYIDALNKKSCIQISVTFKKTSLHTTEELGHIEKNSNLLLARKYVEQIGGTLLVTSKSNESTSYHCTLPSSHECLARDIQSILIIKSNNDLAREFHLALYDEGYLVVRTQTLDAAIELTQQQSFTAVLLDPIQLDKNSFNQIIALQRNLPSNTPLIFINQRPTENLLNLENSYWLADGKNISLLLKTLRDALATTTKKPES